MKYLCKRLDFFSGFQLSDDSIVILSVGELNKNKNHELVIKALSKIHDKKIHYFVAGRGSLENYLTNLANELNISENVHLLGFRNDVSDLYKIADVYVHPSFREGLSVAVMEAMSNGLPMICSEIRGNIDLIKNKDGGFLVSPSSVDDMAESITAICNMTEKDRKKFGEKNKMIMKNFSIEQVMIETKNIYQLDVNK